MQPIHKATVLKKVRESGEWTGYIAPSNVNSFHIKGGWHMGMSITIRKSILHGYTVDIEDGQTRPLQAVLDDFAFHNCGGELGNRIRFWENN